MAASPYVNAGNVNQAMAQAAKKKVQTATPPKQAQNTTKKAPAATPAYQPAPSQASPYAQQAQQSQPQQQQQASQPVSLSGAVAGVTASQPQNTYQQAQQQMYQNAFGPQAQLPQNPYQQAMQAQGANPQWAPGTTQYQMQQQANAYKPPQQASPQPYLTSAQMPTYMPQGQGQQQAPVGGYPYNQQATQQTDLQQLALQQQRLQQNGYPSATGSAGGGYPGGGGGGGGYDGTGGSDEEPLAARYIGNEYGGGGGGGGGNNAGAAAPSPQPDATTPATMDLPSLVQNMLKAQPGKIYKLNPALQKRLADSGWYPTFLNLLKSIGMNDIGGIGQFGFGTDFMVPMSMPNVDINALMAGLSPADKLAMSMVFDNMMSDIPGATPTPTATPPTQ